MAIKATTGTPFTGYLSFSATGGPTAIPIYTIAGSGTAYTLAPTEYCVLTNITISTGSTSVLVTIDDGAATPRNLVKGYVSTTVAIQETITPGVGLSMRRGVNPRATVGAVSATTVEFVIKGFITQT